jgi:type I restriction enzyme, S subunit
MFTKFRLGDICSKIGSGATPFGGSSVYLDDGEVALIRSQNVYNDGFRRDGLAFIASEHARELEHVSVAPGDILLNITGDSVARCCLVDEPILPARVNQHVAIIRPDPQKMDSRFLRYFLVSPQTQAKMLSWAGSGGTRNALTKGMIESFEILAPSTLSEQRTIAESLSSLDEKIELNRRMNETLEAMARAIFKSWFVDFDAIRAKAESRQPFGMDAETVTLFPDSFENSALGRIPRGWRAATIGEIVQIRDSARIPLSSRQRKQQQGIYRYYGAAGILDHVSGFLFDGVYVLAGEDGSVIKEDDTPVLQYVWGKFWVNNHAHVLQGSAGISTEHLLLLLEHANVRPYVTGAVQPKLNQASLRRIPIILPNEQVRSAFRDAIDPLYQLLRANADECTTLATIRDALLPKLVSGDIRVKTAEAVAEKVV